LFRDVTDPPDNGRFVLIYKIISIDIFDPSTWLPSGRRSPKISWVRVAYYDKRIGKFRRGKRRFNPTHWSELPDLKGVEL